jgi:hypothetical protein
MFSILVLDGESSDPLRLESGDQVFLTILDEEDLILWLLLELLDERCGLVGLPDGVLGHGLLVVSLASESSLFDLSFNGIIKSLFVHSFSVELLSEFINIEFHVETLSVEIVLHVLDSDENLMLSIGVN